MLVPGGFAHGDYLRTGAMARFSPVMSAVRAFADAGGLLSYAASLADRSLTARIIATLVSEAVTAIARRL